MLCEFKYGGVPQETFANVLGDQAEPRRVFYHLKKDFFVSAIRVASKGSLANGNTPSSLSSTGKDL